MVPQRRSQSAPWLTFSLLLAGNPEQFLARGPSWFAGRCAREALGADATIVFNLETVALQ